MRKDQDKKSENRETIRALSQLSQIGVTIAATIFVGVFLGKFLDGVFSTSPWLLLICSLLGVGSAIKYLFSYPNDNNIK